MRRLFLNRLIRLLLTLSVIWGILQEVEAVNPANPGKVLHTVFTAQETGFDPAVASDLYSSQVIRSIYEPLLTYDYLARPARLVPETAESLPEISEDGKTYTITVRKGIYFADDPAFGGKRRELVAADYIYSLKRLVDPAVRSAWGWLAFQNREIDLFSLEGPLAPRALLDGQLKPELAEQGIQLSRYVEPELIQFYFNMRDPVVGGLSNEKIALRRAIIMAHNVQEEIDVVWNGQAVMLHFPIPPGVAGYDEAYQGIIGFEPDTANDLLDRYGYAKGTDGWRRQPDGSPLVIVFSARADSTGQQQLEMWKRTFDSLAIQMREDRRPFPDLIKAEKQCQLMMREMAWIADYPDGGNFMQLFYGPHIGQSNHGCVSIPQFDALYEEAAELPDGEARNLLYHKMARLLEVYTPTGMGYAHYRNMLVQPYVIGYKKHPVMHNEWVYSDIDMTKK